MQHSVLGPRWVYDACADPVFVATAIDAISTGAREAALELRRADGTVIARKSSASAHGAGSGDVPQVDAAAPVRATDTADCTIVHADSVTLAVARRIGAILPPGPALTGSFAGGNDLLLATVSSEPV
jgi:hypothetical protein